MSDSGAFKRNIRNSFSETIQDNGYQPPKEGPVLSWNDYALFCNLNINYSSYVELSRLKEKPCYTQSYLQGGYSDFYRVKLKFETRLSHSIADGKIAVLARKGVAVPNPVDVQDEKASTVGYYFYQRELFQVLDECASLDRTSADELVKGFVKFRQFLKEFTAAMTDYRDVAESLVPVNYPVDQNRLKNRPQPYVPGCSDLTF